MFPKSAKRFSEKNMRIQKLSSPFGNGASEWASSSPARAIRGETTPAGSPPDAGEDGGQGAMLCIFSFRRPKFGVGRP
jgi:hypothetical protein